MSSILDALNKLEQEKSQTIREAEHADTDPMSAANDLVGRSLLRDRVTLRVTPAALMITAGVVAVGLVVVAFSVGILVMKSARSAKPGPEVAAVDPALAIAVPVKTEAPAKMDVSPKATTPAIAAPAPEIKAADPAVQKETPPSKPLQSTPPPKPAATTVVDPPEAIAPQAEPRPTHKKTLAPRAAIAPTEIPAAVEEETESKPAPTSSLRVAARSAPETPTAARALPGAPARPASAASLRLDQLPVLTPLEQLRFGFVRIKVNMMKPSGDTTPRGLAVMTLSEAVDGGEPKPNTIRVYEGERLQQSSLLLFKVEATRVGIEDTRSGERYQLPN